MHLCRDADECAEKGAGALLREAPPRFQRYTDLTSAFSSLPTLMCKSHPGRSYRQRYGWQVTLDRDEWSRGKDFREVYVWPRLGMPSSLSKSSEREVAVRSIQVQRWEE